MNVLLLGGAGFIGTHLIKKLNDENYNVTVYDRRLSQKNLPESEIRIIEGNFLEEDNFDEILESQDIIIHLISSVSPVSSMYNVSAAYQHDVLQTLKILETARKKGINKMIFLSSGGTVYGDYSFEALNEDTNCNPLNHYGIMKLTIEKILLLYNQLYSMNNIILRVANPYGSGQDLRKKIGAVSVFLDSILRGETITIYGDGSAIRDYIEITDVCSAILLAIKYTHKIKEVSPVFNVGTGIGTSLNDLISKIEHLTRIKANVEFKKSRNIDVARNVLDPRRSKEYLSFYYTLGIEEGINKLIHSYYDDEKLV